MENQQQQQQHKNKNKKKIVITEEELDGVYKGVFGFIPQNEIHDIEIVNHCSETYGELAFKGVQDLITNLKQLDATNNDTANDADDLSDHVFMDLGSGCGRLILQMALQTNMRKLIGIELSSTRYNDSITALQSLHKLYNSKILDLNNNRVSLIHDNFFNVNCWSESTILFCFWTTFPISIKNQIVQTALTQCPILKYFIVQDDVQNHPNHQDYYHSSDECKRSFKMISQIDLDSNFCNNLTFTIYSVNK